MKKLLVVGVLGLVCLFSNAQAAILDINVGDYYGFTSGTGNGRAIGFLANEDFHMSSFGVFGNLNPQSFDVVVYSSANGVFPGSILDSYSSAISNAGTAWYDISTDFSFDQGNYYIVNWRPSNASYNWGTVEYYKDEDFPTNLGILTAIEGIEGYDAQNYTNYVYVRSRINYSQNAVPEPASLGLLSLGVLGIGVLKRKKLKV